MKKLIDLILAILLEGCAAAPSSSISPEEEPTISVFP
jgi:PBP1b-binding outer membrane lipoprotein LpoB